jgi:hypothetical protein
LVSAWSSQQGAIGGEAFELRGGGCGEAAKSVTLDFNYTCLSQCKYRAPPIRGTFTTHPEDAMLTMKPQFEKEVASPIFCPTAISSQTLMTMERDALTSEPVYIS